MARSNKSDSIKTPGFGKQKPNIPKAPPQEDNPKLKDVPKNVSASGRMMWN